MASHRRKRLPYVAYAILIRPKSYPFRRDISALESEIDTSGLARILHCSVGAVRTHLEHLELLGLIELVSRRGSRPEYITIRLVQESTRFQQAQVLVEGR